MKKENERITGEPFNENARKEYIKQLLASAEINLLCDLISVGKEYKSLPAYQLFEQLIELITSDVTLESILIKNGAKNIVDKFYFNGNFIERGKQPNQPPFIQSWERFCEKNAILYNGQVCCINIGF